MGNHTRNWTKLTTTKSREIANYNKLNFLLLQDLERFSPWGHIAVALTVLIHLHHFPFSIAITAPNPDSIADLYHIFSAVASMLPLSGNMRRNMLSTTLLPLHCDVAFLSPIFVTSGLLPFILPLLSPLATLAFLFPTPLLPRHCHCCQSVGCYK